MRHRAQGMKGFKIFPKFFEISENLDGINEKIPKIYICLGIVAEINIQKIVRKFLEFFW